MKFKSFVGKQLFVGSKVLTFKGELYETSDKEEIEALEKANDVEKVVSKREKAPD